MITQFKRTDRVAVTIQRKLAQIIQQEIQDPRLSSLITIAAVHVARDLGHAKVYFSIYDGDPIQTAIILNAAASYLRTALSRTSTLRMMPKLHFIHDNSIEYGARLSRMIDDLNTPVEDSNPQVTDA